MPYTTPCYFYPKGPFVLCHSGSIPFTPDLPPEGSSNSYQCQSQPLHSWTLKSQRNVPPCPRSLQGPAATIPTYPIVPNPYSLLSSIPLPKILETLFSQSHSPTITALLCLHLGRPRYTLYSTMNLNDPTPWHPRHSLARGPALQWDLSPLNLQPTTSHSV